MAVREISSSLFVDVGRVTYLVMVVESLHRIFSLTVFPARPFFLSWRPTCMDSARRVFSRVFHRVHPH